MNLLNQQLYQKNTLLKTYEKQNERLKDIISKQKNEKYIKFPKDGLSSNRVNTLEMQNYDIKSKLNDTLMLNTQLMNKVQKEKLFNRKLQAENEALKTKVRQLNQKLEVKNSQSLVNNIEKGIIDFSMMKNIADTKMYQQTLVRDKVLSQNKTVQKTLVDGRKSHSIFETVANIQPMELISRVFSHSKISPQQSDTVIRTLNMQREKQQYLQEIQYLQKQLQLTKAQLQKSQNQVKTLKQKVKQLEENNRSQFVLAQNDTLQGQLTQMQLIRSTLQLGLLKAAQQNEIKQKQLQDFKSSMYHQIHTLHTENEILRRTFLKESHRKQSFEGSLRQSRKSNIQTVDKRRKNSEVSIKSQKSIKESNQIACRTQMMESKIQIMMESERGRKDKSMSRIKDDTKQKSTNDTKEIQSLGEHYLKPYVNNQSYQKKNYEEEDFSTYLRVPLGNNEGRETIQMLDEENMKHYPKEFQEYLVTQPVIKQTRVSFMLDDIVEEDMSESQQQNEHHNKQEQINDREKMLLRQPQQRQFQNSLLSARNRGSTNKTGPNQYRNSGVRDSLNTVQHRNSSQPEMGSSSSSNKNFWQRIRDAIVQQ